VLRFLLTCLVLIQEQLSLSVLFAAVCCVVRSNRSFSFLSLFFGLFSPMCTNLDFSCHRSGIYHLTPIVQSPLLVPHSCKEKWYVIAILSIQLCNVSAVLVADRLVENDVHQSAVSSFDSGSRSRWKNSAVQVSSGSI